MNEAAFVAALRGLAHVPAARGLADDAAVLAVGGEALVVTHDMMVEGVHWLPGQDPADVAWKLVAVNVSDLAAKGAEPVGVLLGHMLGDRDERFLEGLGEALARFRAPLIGGDTVAGGGGARALGLTAIGRAVHQPVPARAGAQPGDGVWVTGALGAALAGYEALRGGSAADTGSDSTAYRRPCARLDEGIALAPHVTAMMDVSDGLLLDAWRMAAASGATLALDRAAVPIALPEPRRDAALRWGDDYELLFTLPGDARPPVAATCIGTVRPQGVAPLLLDGVPLARDGLGFEHG